MSTRPRLSEWESTWAFVTGGGLLLIILAFGLSAIRGADAGGALNGMLVIGILLAIGGTAGWLIQYQPWKAFDDMSTPLYTGHDAHGHDDAHSEALAAEREMHGESGVPETSHEPPVLAAASVQVKPSETDGSQVSLGSHGSQSTGSQGSQAEPALPPPPVIMDPMTAFPPATPSAPQPPAAPATSAPVPSVPTPPEPELRITHLEPNEIEEKPLDTPLPHDNLQKLEGIGPKIEAALMAAGIFTFADLAKHPPETLEKIVRDAGVRMVGHASTWVTQANMAAAGDTAGLEQYQKTLRSGQNT